MDGNRIMQQVSSIFSAFMVFFYIGVGSFLVFFFDQSYININKPTRVIIGTAFMIYGIFRAFRTVFQLKELFFDKETDDE